MTPSFRTLLPLTVAFALGLTMVACGRKPAALPANVNQAAAYESKITAWLQAWHNAGFPTLDQDYSSCLGPGSPTSIPSVPDSSGHTRPRISCPDAVKNIEAKLGAYQEMVKQLEGFTGPTTDPRINATQKAFVAYNAAELSLYEDAVAALHKGDDQAMSDLRNRYADLAKLDTTAIDSLTKLMQNQK